MKKNLRIIITEEEAVKITRALFELIGVMQSSYPEVTKKYQNELMLIAARLLSRIGRNICEN